MDPSRKTVTMTKHSMENHLKEEVDDSDSGSGSGYELSSEEGEGTRRTKRAKPQKKTLPKETRKE
jgi:hypothetical protein